MLLGTDCTRRCAFCAVHTHWPRGVVDSTEPERVAEAVRDWGLRYVVLTQVCRDDLEDGGAFLMAETVRSIRARCPETLIELLIGDLGVGSHHSGRSWTPARTCWPTISKRYGACPSSPETIARGTTDRRGSFRHARSWLRLRWSRRAR